MMVFFKVQKRLLLTISILCLFFFSLPFYQASASSEDQLMSFVGDALVKAKNQDWQGVKQNLQAFQQELAVLSLPDTNMEKLNTALLQANKALLDAQAKPDKAFQAISNLAKVTDESFAEVQPTTQKLGKTEANKLKAIMQTCLTQATNNQWVQAKKCNEQFVANWVFVESVIRKDSPTSYGQLEAKMSLVRIYLQAEPPNQAKVVKAMQDLIQTLQAYVTGTIQATTVHNNDTLPSIIAILQKAEEAIEAGKVSVASEQMQLFIQKWPNVEGSVQGKSPETYTKIENQMTLVSSYLVSQPPQLEKASEDISKMQNELQTVIDKGNYTAWDAGIILLREGLEAVFVLAALLAFLKRSNNQAKRKWIWSGAATGVLLSVVTAFVLHAFLSNVSSGSTRELLEGITGIVAVIMMITVGVWLHSQSNLQKWKQYVNQKMSAALATGSLWSLFALSGLAVLREGAETLIFYMGIAPSIETNQLVLGTVVSTILLLVIGFITIQLSTRLPIRPFFMTAAIFIYYLTIKFMGESIHSLQIADKLSVHASDLMPTISWLGVYPTWESLVSQIVVLFIIVGLTVRNRGSKQKEKTSVQVT